MFPRAVLLIPAFLVFLFACPTLAQNRALRVSGAGYLEVPSHPSLEPSQALTVEAWIRAEGGFSHGRIVRKEVAATGYHLSWSFQRAQLSAIIICGSGDVIYDPRPNSDYLGEWHHLAMTARLPGDLRLYVDGELVSETPITTDCLGHAGKFTIGNREGGGEGFIGLVDDVRFWSVERTEAEIRANMTRRFVSGDGLVSVWHMDGGGEDSQFGNDGVLVGDATFVPSDSPVRDFDITETLGDLRGGTKTRLIGDFPPFDEEPVVRFGDRTAVATVIDARTIEATVPASEEPGAIVRIRVVLPGWEGEATQLFTYTPRLVVDGDPLAGGLLEGRFSITPGSTVLGLFGKPPAVDLGVRQYGGRLNLLPFYPVFLGTYPFQSEVPFSGIVPDGPGVVGKSFLIQCLAGQALDGRRASFSNTVSITVR